MSRERGPGPVPERWLNCPRKGLSLVRDKFLAFKTPLNHRFDREVGPACRWDPAMVLENTKTFYKVRFGMWIDLTNTNRFYDSEEVTNGYDDGHDVTYIKLKCRGHGEPPSLDQTRDFINICDNFIKNRPLEIIGVHCTHGFNRTGFLIVSYLVEISDLSVACALQEFAKCRPPGIYKGDYIKELYRRYEDVEDAIDPPLRPTWCFDVGNGNISQDDDFDEETYSIEQEKRKKNHSEKDSTGSQRKRSRRDVKVPKFMEGVSGVTPVLEPSKIKALQKLAQEMCGWKGNSFPGSQPVSMNMENITFLKENPYRVSWKADGTRYMMLIVGENQVYFLDRDNSVFEVSGLRFVHRKNLNQHITDTLMDGEMVIDRHEGKSIPRYLIYDIVKVNGFDVKDLPFFPQRLDCIEADIIRPRHDAMFKGRIDKTAEPFSVRAKTFYSLDKAGSFFSKKFCQQLTHEPDGLIFQPTEDAYKPGPCEEVLKWKPASQNSVDFRLKIVMEEGEGILKRKVGHLFVGGLERPYASMKYRSSIKDYDNKIIECKCENKNWVFMRERIDKSFPNSFQTAQSVLESIRNPVTKEYLLDIIARCRYRSDKELMRPPPTRVK